MSSPHRSLLSALFATAIVVTVVLMWFGWKTLTEHGIVEQQRVRERVETSADAIAASISGRLAEVGERLSGWLAQTPSALPDVPGAAVFAAAGNRFSVSPAGALPFVPRSMPLRPLHPLLADAEAIEFRSADLLTAIARYRELIDHPDAGVRAGALMRYARVLRKSGRLAEAAAAYVDLGMLGSLDVDGYPAALAALDGQLAAAAAGGDGQNERRLAGEIVRSIDEGRWLLSRGMAEQYRDRFGATPKPESWLIAEALATAADISGERGLRVVDLDGRRVVVLWRASAGAVAGAAGFAERLLPPVFASGVSYQLTDTRGSLVSGSASPPAHAVGRVVGDMASPWTLKVWAAGAPDAGDLSQSTMLVLISAVVLFLWAAVYFMARAIRREAAVARLQSDFVAAVSHEFRSPLTTVRQLAEMLEADRVPSEERRRKYYEVLASEATRLQRLVETLLNFGKMEANAQQYRFESLDVPAVVREAAADAGRVAQQSGRIETSGPESVPPVMGDADALGVALRNLVDNALKYSPAAEPVRVEWGAQNGHVAISVIDRGLGIATAERAVIFQKFVRGRAATAGNIKGTGVGLAMVRHIVTAHRGEILVESEPGAGSTFTITLPVGAVRDPPLL